MPMGNERLVVIGLLVLFAGYVAFSDDRSGEVKALRLDLVQAGHAANDLRAKIRDAEDATQRQVEEVQRQKHEAGKAKDKVRDLEVELGNLRMLQNEAQRTEEELDDTKQRLRMAEEANRRLSQSIMDERTVSQKSEEALQVVMNRAKATEAQLAACEKDESRDQASAREQLDVMEKLKGELKLAKAETELSKVEAMEEGEKAKDLESRLDEVSEELMKLKVAHSTLQERYAKAVEDVGTNLLIEDKEERRKALLDTERERTARLATDPDRAAPLKVATWNIAAVNNNPFEYWITGTDEYNAIMEGVAEFISDPKDRDIAVGNGVFTDEMWNDLKMEMKAVQMHFVDEVEEIWVNDFKHRKIISEFLKDAKIGKKRLASMPDRYTNTIATASGMTKMRPTVINCYEGDLSTQEEWWAQWKRFMFHDEIQVLKKGRKTTKNIYELLKTISKAKYPDVTEEEEKISIALQTLAAAVFDATLVHMMNTISHRVWETTRLEMCDKLNKGKNARAVGILNAEYSDSDVLFLQEVSGDFDKAARRSKTFQDHFEIFVSDKADESRGQNSYIVLKQGVFTDVEEVTPAVLAELPTDEDVPVAAGDLFAVTARHSSGVEYLFASFHGDTNGLATIPVVKAMHKYHEAHASRRKLVFGMDANTYERPAADQQGVTDFASFYREHGLTSCYGDYPDPANYTTFHARTHLQPQLNKAISSQLKDVLGDKNPKDHILFYNNDFVTVHTQKDNTGERKYTEGMVFPTLQFPSDHGITSTVLKFSSAADVRRRAEKEADRLKSIEQARLEAVTWNVAAVNNNPFEYWIDGTTEYNKLMEGVAEFITDPGDRDVRVSKVFTQSMWESLMASMRGADVAGVDVVDKMWLDDFSNRLIISEFLKDKDIGLKRLASMPDRYTNTIEQDGGNVMRPTVINCFTGDLSTTDKWWNQWRDFFFEKEVELDGSKKLVHKLLKKIKRSKYPAVTEEEEEVSIPLQTMAQAIFDAVLVHMMNTVAPGVWESLRTEMCSKLNTGKSERTAKILEKEYRGAQVVFLQEVSNDFQDAAVRKSVLSYRFDMHVPEKMDAARGQNSIILLKKHEWTDATEVTEGVSAMLPSGETIPIATGDLFALTATWKHNGDKYVFASFHGDTNGLATIPVVNAFHKFAESQGIKNFIFGLDANSHAVGSTATGTLGVTEFAKSLREQGLTSCYGDYPNPHNYTTFHARTHLQPQLNKAVALTDRDAKGDKNPKDHIVFAAQRFVAVSTQKDNTGERKYTEGMVFPTLQFPSDHGITSTVLEHRARPAPHEESVPEGSVVVSTWNVAAVNNNPFEYWISGTDEYNKLMSAVAAFITSPGEEDVKVSKVFTPAMWADLRSEMETRGVKDLDIVEGMYRNDFQDRKIITEFIQDKALGKKRLASMPDRVTNTIRTTAGNKMRPTVINCYEGDLSTQEKWWAQWKRFMFVENLHVGDTTKHAFEMLKKIKMSKYPAVTEEEEAVSIPLQTLTGAIFDAVLVHMMNTVALKAWEGIRTEMCDKLNRHKDRLIGDILDKRYYENDVVFLQEVSSALVRERVVRAGWDVRVGKDFDAEREQNSVILLKKHEWFDVEEVEIELPADAPVAKGDLFVLRATRMLRGEPKAFLLASFHGDTNGLATIPITKAVKAYADDHPDMLLLFGMDANTYEHPADDQQGIADFAKYYTSAGLSSCYGDNPDPKGYTTFHARTHLQPQLNKAVAAEDRDKNGDKNPKDHIIFGKRALVTQKVGKDNTGERTYTEGMVFPTLKFPSDHGITTAMLRETNDADIRAIELAAKALKGDEGDDSGSFEEVDDSGSEEDDSGSVEEDSDSGSEE